ncbi:bZIP transcription factor [Spirosoma sp. BT702]|uniref:BZIP transcription factor n=1 Tax=Spirosoma profusum TaxID=2771354 RepID=A0A927AQJ2_9BACT|nr:bZIP transcription factor [Spirosoma profusum]
MEVPVGTPLTVQGNLNLPTGFNVLVNNQTYIKQPTAGSSNVYMGLNAGTSGGGTNNLAIGTNAGPAITAGGNNNVFLGSGAGASNTTGTANVFIGANAGLSNLTGTGNMFIGQLAGLSTTGSYNLFLGNSSGQQTTGGAGNTFIGNGSGYANTSGQNNTYIGNSAGFTGNATGQANTFIGYGAGTNGPNVNNSTAIGVNAVVTADNSIIIGAANAAWKVGIGNTAPQNKVEITAGVAATSGLRFTNLKSTDAASMTNQTKVLSVNASGDVILVSTNASTREGVTEAFWQRKGSFLQSTQDDAVIIGANTRTPVGYKLFVEQGILTEKVKVALKNTSDWSDYVFQSDYKLKSLSEVESFIQANKHLPGVPSAQEMVEKGNDLHKTDAKLLEKIEELTLYSIQQQKEIDQLKQLVKQLVEKK